MKKSGIARWVILAVAIAINVFIIVNACITGSVSAQESGNVSRFIASIINTFVPNAINDGNFDQFTSVIRKLVGHFGLFAVDGVFSTLAFHLFLKETKFNNPYWTLGGSLTFGFIVAGVSEIIQIFTPDRYGTWADIGIDFGGYCLGFALTFLILFLSKQIVFPKKEK